MNRASNKITLVSQDEAIDEWAGLTSLLALLRQYPVRIIAITTLTALIGFALANQQGKSFESSIYLGLGDWQDHNPVLDGLGIPIGTEDTKDAVSIIKSQAVLGLVVSGADQGPESFRLGLTSWIEDLSSNAIGALRPGGTQSDRTSQALRGSFDGPVGHDLSLYFEDASHVWVTPADTADNTWSHPAAANLDTQARLLDLDSGSPMEFAGHRLTLIPGGDLSGRSFLLHRLNEHQAIDRLRASVSLQIPSERNQVLRATMRSNQAIAAQVLVTAISEAFLHHEHATTFAQAKSVVDYLQGELSLRQSELRRLDSIIAEVRLQNPDLADPPAVLIKLNAKLAEAQAALKQTTQNEVQLAQALESQSLSDLSLITLRRIIKDPQVDRWLDRIDEFQNLILGAQQPKNPILLEDQNQRLEALQVEEQSAQRFAELFDNRLSDFLEGQPASLAALLDDNGQDLAQTQPMIELAVRPFRQAQAKLVSTREIYKDKHPYVVAAQVDLERIRIRLIAALHAHSASLQENHRRVLSALEPLRLRLESAPAEELQRWSQGQSALWAKVRRALDAQRNHRQEQTALHQSTILALSGRLERLPFDQGVLQTPLVQRRALSEKIQQLLDKREDAEVALSGLRTGAKILEPASNSKLRQPHLDRLGSLVGLLIGLLISLTWAQFASQKKRPLGERTDTSDARPPHINLPVLSRMIRACMDDNFAVGHPMGVNVQGPAFAALRRLRVQLNLLAKRNWNTSLLGVTSLVAELNEFGTEEEPSLRHLTSDSWKGSFTPTPSLVTSTIGALAISHAMANKKVVLVDGNVFGDSLSTHLNLVSNPGLTECLMGASKWQNHLVSVEPNQVDVLPLGQAIGQGDDLLAHPDLPILLKEMEQHYDIVLVELPGVNEAPNLPRLTRHLGSVLLVENARIQLDMVESAGLLEPLRRSGTRLVGSFVALRGALRSRSRAA